MSSEPTKFGKLRLSVKGTQNGSGFDIFYDFGKSHYFVEFTSKPEFYFVQPWMQFPAQAYTDECMRVSIELVHRFNAFEEQKDKADRLWTEVERLRAKIAELERTEKKS